MNQQKKYDAYLMIFDQSKLLPKQVIAIITCMHDISTRRYLLKDLSFLKMKKTVKESLVQMIWIKT